MIKNSSRRLLGCMRDEGRTKNGKADTPPISYTAPASAPATKTAVASIHDNGRQSFEVNCYCTVNILMLLCVFFTLNRSFYPTTSVHLESVLFFHPNEIPGTNYVVTDCCETEHTKNDRN